MNNILYKIDLDIDVKNESIKSDLNLKYYSNTDNREEIILYLYYNLSIEYIGGDDVKSYSILSEKVKWNPFTFLAQKIKIKLDKPLNKGESADIKIKYSGVISQKGVNIIGREFVELSLYSNWFPLTDSIFRKTIFDVNLSIDNGYKVVSSPDLIKEDSRYKIKQKSQYGDCTIIASSKLKTIENNNEEVSVYYIRSKHKAVAQKTNIYSEWLVDYFVNIFGNISKLKNNIVILPRNKWGGYSRHGLIVLSANMAEDKELKLFRNLAHELSHHWWNNAEITSWEDWLNESFAEYSSLMGVRMKFGEKKFNKLLKKYQNKNSNLSAIKELDREDDNAYMTLNCKGPVLLNRLEDMIGKYKFEELLQRKHLNNISSTEEFLKLLSEMSGEAISKEFDELLRK